jgi:hypothetical protein
MLTLSSVAFHLPTSGFGTGDEVVVIGVVALVVGAVDAVGVVTVVVSVVVVLAVVVVVFEVVIGPTVVVAPVVVNGCGCPPTSSPVPVQQRHNVKSARTDTYL